MDGDLLAGLPQWQAELIRGLIVILLLLYFGYCVENMGANERKKLFELEMKRKAILDML